MTCSYCHKCVRSKNRIFCSYYKVYCHLSCAFLKSIDLEKVNNNWMCATCFISFFRLLMLMSLSLKMHLVIL